MIAPRLINKLTVFALLASLSRTLLVISPDKARAATPSASTTDKSHRTCVNSFNQGKATLR
ncbi:MAG TPA: hypothetical protein VEW46_05115 [Pyrinomonadaceae bacterium]|nr:hypothetical protein [Pyrinomonadaceae bacterium]